MTKKELFLKLWNNKQTHAAIVLGLWLIFMAGVVIIINVGLRMGDNKVKTSNDVSIDQIIANVGDNYEYNVTIINTEKTTFNGKKFADKETGYKETSNSLIKYYVDSTGTYEIKMGEKVLTNNLYENINKDILNLHYVFNLIKDIKPTITNKDNGKIYDYKTTLFDIYLLTDNSVINEITVSDLNSTYKMAITNYGNVKESDFN